MNGREICFFLRNHMVHTYDACVAHLSFLHRQVSDVSRGGHVTHVLLICPPHRQIRNVSRGGHVTPVLLICPPHRQIRNVSRGGHVPPVSRGASAIQGINVTYRYTILCTRHIRFKHIHHQSSKNGMFYIRINKCSI